jgi:uncharacterized protein with HEPN domain
MPHDEVTILDLARAARLVLEFVRGLDRDAFDRDSKTQSAVLHQLLVLGEAVKRLSPDFRAAHATVPWAQIAGMRDKLIHAYDEVDIELVWRTVERDLPPLLNQLEQWLPDSPPP